MNRWIREAGRGICALLCIATLIVQSVLPVYADTADTENEAAGIEYELDYFNRIAVNSVKGIVTIRTGEDFGISFPAGWEELPGFSVQDEILVVSGRKTRGGGSDQSDSETAVILGEDEPAAAGGQTEKAAPQTEAGENTETAEASTGTAEVSAESAEASTETEEENSEAAETDQVQTSAPSGEMAAVVPEMEITVPAGIGIDTLRIAMESGNLNLKDITANSVTIQSGGGSLYLRDVSLGTVDIYTETGEIFMADSTFTNLNIGMGNGSVSVSADEGLSGCRMELKTGNGEVLYNGASQGAECLIPGSGKRSLTVQIGSGSITVDG